MTTIEERLNAILDNRIQVRAEQLEWIKILIEQKKDFIGIARTG
jgi:hypothetical protein